MTPEEKAGLQRSRFLLFVLALTLIGAGLFFWHPPAAPVAVGLLIWIDLQK